MSIRFRPLRADEIECRVSNIDERYAQFLLYKDARCDMNILDETVGAERWKREHTRDNRNCIVSIWSDELKQWVSKEDVGSESNIEKEKGVASDSFKRACTNWGIGRELYTSPQIKIPTSYLNTYVNKYGNISTYDKAIVKRLEIIEDENTGVKKIGVLEIYIENSFFENGSLKERRDGVFLYTSAEADKDNAERVSRKSPFWLRNNNQNNNQNNQNNSQPNNNRNGNNNRSNNAPNNNGNQGNPNRPVDNYTPQNEGRPYPNNR